MAFDNYNCTIAESDHYVDEINRKDGYITHKQEMLLFPGYSDYLPYRLINTAFSADLL